MPIIADSRIQITLVKYHVKQFARRACPVAAFKWHKHPFSLQIGSWHVAYWFPCRTFFFMKIYEKLIGNVRKNASFARYFLFIESTPEMGLLSSYPDKSNIILYEYYFYWYYYWILLYYPFEGKFYVILKSTLIFGSCDLLSRSTEVGSPPGMPGSSEDQALHVVETSTEILLHSSIFILGSVIRIGRTRRRDKNSIVPECVTVWWKQDVFTRHLCASFAISVVVTFLSR